MSAEPLLSVEGLSVAFRAGRDELVAVDDVSFAIAPGEALGIVGESGSGKSVTALAVMGLLPEPQGRVTAGAIRFEGRDLLTLPRRDRRALGGRALAMIFQEPMTSLNPVFTVGEQISESIRHHEGLSKAAARARAIDLLATVGIPAPARRFDDYPHRMSGGMRQRVMIAIALAARPRLLIADEPTTALDVTIQAQIIELLQRLRGEFGMAVVLITHDMGVIAEFADRVLVMYAGRVAEEAPVARLFDRPSHPYTRGLLASRPDPDVDIARLPTIGGALPSLAAPPPGCRFAPRCGLAVPACAAARPGFVAVGEGHRAACPRVEAATGEGGA
jgi:oligopeptide/dipeptide ABC transporter ATP-binding protein